MLFEEFENLEGMAVHDGAYGPVYVETVRDERAGAPDPACGDYTELIVVFQNADGYWTAVYNDASLQSYGMGEYDMKYNFKAYEFNSIEELLEEYDVDQAGIEPDETFSQNNVYPLYTIDQHYGLGLYDN